MLCHVLFTRQLRGIVACLSNVRAWCASAHKNGSSAPVSDTVSPRLPVLAQDSHVHTSLGGNKALYAVFDGHGGAQVRAPARRQHADPSAFVRPGLYQFPALGSTGGAVL